MHLQRDIWLDNVKGLGQYILSETRRHCAMSLYTGRRLILGRWQRFTYSAQ